MNNSIARLTVLLSGLFSFNEGIAQSFTVETVNSFVSVSEPAIHPDGTKAVFITSRRKLETNSFDRSLIMTDIRGNQKIVVENRAGVRSPQWSPSGDFISFIASSEGKSQIFLLPAQGGEARQLSLSPTSIETYTWSPDGNQIAFVSNEDKDEPTGIDRFNDAFEVGSDHVLTRERPSPAFVSVISVSTGQVKRVLPSGHTVSTGLVTSSLSWSPDSKRLAFTIFPSSSPGDSDLGLIHILDLASGKLEKVTSHTGMEGGAFFPPAGNQVLYSYSRNGIPSNVNEIYSTDLKTGNTINLTLSVDREILWADWIGNSLTVLCYNGPQTTLLVQAGDKFVPAEMGDVVEVSTISAAKNGNMILVGEEKYRASELYFKRDAKSPPVRLTNYNAEIAGLKHGKREVFTWKSSDGFQPDGVLTYPPDFAPDKKYPMVLLIHGGPTSVSGVGFNFLPQLMAAKGWLVFEPNYRGSNNLGNAYQAAIANDAAEGPGQDVMTGVEELKKKPFVDGNKIAVSGWSYGGWMTAWMIGRYPEEWVAAVAGASPVDYTDMYSLSDLNRMRRHAITDSPYKNDNLEKAYQQSPIKNFPRIKAPTLIMHKTEDSRVSIVGSYKLFNALRDNGVETQFIAYPGPGHVVTDPVRSLDVYGRWIQWLEKYLGNPLRLPPPR